MEKKTLKDRIQKGFAAIWEAVKAHPVELEILVYVCVAMCCGLAHDGDADWEVPWWLRPVVLAPFMVVAAYSLQPFRKRGIGYLVLYLLPLAVMVVACFMPFLIDWPEETSYWIAALVGLPLWMCVRHWLTENESFVQRNVQMAWSLARALLVAGIFYLLYAAIAYTITSLFDIDYKTWNGWYGQVAVVLFCGLAPVLFFAMEDQAEIIEIRRFWAVLLNWVLTPALLIYTGVLYIYAAKILFTWNLPKGGVAIMVTVFFVVFFAAKMLEILTEPRPFKWFYDHFSLFALPLLALFWTGLTRRLMDYGLTESRYYLILLGGLMTLIVIVFLFQNRHGYFALAAGALCVVLLTVLLPPLRGEKVAMRSQLHRVRTLAQQLDRLNDDGTLRCTRYAESDSVNVEQAVKHRRIYQSLDYLSRSDTDILRQEFGIEHKSDYLISLSPKTAKYAEAWSEESAQKVMETWGNLGDGDVFSEPDVYLQCWLDKKSVDISGYRRMFGTSNSVRGYAEDNQIKVDGKSMSVDTLFWRQVHQLGGSYNTITRQWLEDRQDELLVCRTDSLLVWFNYLYVNRSDNGEWKINSYGVECVLVK